MRQLLSPAADSTGDDLKPDRWNMLVGGSPRGAAAGRTYPVHNPADRSVIAIVPDGEAEDAVDAVDAASEAFVSWRETTPLDRATALRTWHDLIRAHKERIARLLTEEQGKPLREARAEVDFAAGYALWYAEESRRVYGEIVPSTPERRALVMQQPAGVVGAITPWNFPAVMITRKAAPAIAAGCTVILKPAEETPLCALALAELGMEAGLPSGVLNIVTTNQPEKVGTVLLEDERVKVLTFTGSTEVGRRLYGAASRHIKRLSLELGGHAPFIVFDDADIESAVEGAIASKFRNSGQTCICGNRFFVHADVMDEFLKRLLKRVGEMKIGAGTDQNVEIGPLINDQGLRKVEEHVADARALGGRVLCGGEALGHSHETGAGAFFPPTVISEVTAEMKVFREETFGPVLPICTYRDESEVISHANDSFYGLAAYAYTRNLARAYRIAEKLDYGIVGINDPVPTIVEAPFGGVKESGLGREGGRQGIHEYLEPKYVSLGMS